MEIPSEYIQIIVAAIYAIALFYTIVTFQRSKRLDQITSLGDVMKELRDVDRELAKIPLGSQYDDVRSSWYSRMFNSLEWLSFMINEKIIIDKKLIEYIKPMIISYYEDTFLKSASAIERDSYHYQQFKKLYQAVKRQAQANKQAYEYGVFNLQFQVSLVIPQLLGNQGEKFMISDHESAHIVTLEEKVSNTNLYSVIRNMEECQIKRRAVIVYNLFNEP